MDKQIFFLGAGNMAEGIIGGLLMNKVFEPYQITIYDVSEPRMDYMIEKYGVISTPDPASGLADADIMLLAVRPQDMGQIRWIKEAEKKESLLTISIVSSTLISTIAGVIGEGKIARLMPNTLIQAQHGYSALCANAACTEEDKAALEEIGNAIGQTMYVEEKLFNAWTGFATSGPLMVYKFIYGMIEGGVYSGFPLEQSKKIVYENIIGAGLTLRDTGDYPLQIVDRMATPGGVGIEQFKTLEEGNFTNLCMDAVWNAVQKAEKMAEKYKVE
ncbi:MAG: pyrroline-5-carboxylate reductase [Clostridia bacterium]|nr:pyrroline-5-carboxylate reductase [Clostridia bacterium]